jgi:hypothetical protein
MASQFVIPPAKANIPIDKTGSRQGVSNNKPTPITAAAQRLVNKLLFIVS